MEFPGRGKKRSFTDTFKYTESAGGLHPIKFSRLTTLVFADDSRTPVYTPGPRPSELLKKFIGKKEPEKLTRIDEIKNAPYAGRFLFVLSGVFWKCIPISFKCL